MKHYVQYHNTEKIGSRPVRGADGFSIFSSKHIRHLIGQQVWLISGVGEKRKTFYLEYMFTVDSIQQGSPNSVHGSNGFAFDPPFLLSGLTWFEEFKKSQQNFSLGVREIDLATVKQLETLVNELETPEDRAFRLASTISASQFLAVLRNLESQFTQAQKEMLLGHVNARSHEISMGHLAVLAGYSGFEAANVQYGKVGSLLAEALGIHGLSQKTQMIGTASRNQDDSGHWQWKMRPALVEALKQLWPTTVFQKPDELVAAAEIDADADGRGLRPTQRATLVQARIGQGDYRKKLLDLWQRRCAVTGCDIDQVLIASHAKPWSKCSNQERLDPFNGLLLTASVDRLFDSGLISFTDDGLILVSSQLTEDQLHVLSLSKATRLRHISDRHKAYLKAHREQVFRSDEGV